MKFELDWDVADQITTHTLKNIISNIASEEDTSMLEHLIPVLEYFYGEKNTAAFLKENNIEWVDEVSEIVIDDIVDNPDGSANITFRADKDTTMLLAGEGLKYLLIKASLNNISDEDLMFMFQR
jgi:hypothetical protein